MRAQVAIVGAGVSGLATAFYLGKAGIRSLLVEKNAHLGGLVRTEYAAGCLLEAGPDSFLAAKPAVAELASELPDLNGQTLAAQIIGSNDSARRVFIARGGKLVALPRGMAMMTPGEWRPALTSNLFSAKTKLRLLRETFTLPRMRNHDVAIGEFVEEHFGPELLEYVAEPLLMGVYGGDATLLSVRSVLPRFLAYEEKYGSLIRAVRHERRQTQHPGSLFCSFRDGMQSFTDAIASAAAAYSTVLRAHATRLERTPGAWKVWVGETCIAEAEHVVLACPAHAAAKLVEREAPSLGNELAAIPYSSAILVTLVFERSALEHSPRGFGFLVPRAERRTISAATFVSTKFPSRIPPELAAVRVFIVGKQAEELMNAADSELLVLGSEDLSRFASVRAAPRLSLVHRWPRSMPQYVVGHEQRWLTIQSALAGVQNLHLTGNSYEGVGIPDCVRAAKQTAKRILDSARVRGAT